MNFVQITDMHSNFALSSAESRANVLLLLIFLLAAGKLLLKACILMIGNCFALMVFVVYLWYHRE